MTTENARGNPSAVETLTLAVYARHEALATYAGRSKAAGIELRRIMEGEGVSWHPARGAARREAERVIESAIEAGHLAAIGGKTAARRLALTVAGVWSAAAWLGGRLEKTLAMLAEVESIGRAEAGCDTVSPGGLVPTFRLAPICGPWWGGIDPSRRHGVQDTFARLTPAVLAGWCGLSYQGNRGEAWHWWSVTDAGRETLKGWAAGAPGLRALATAGQRIRRLTTLEVCDRFLAMREREALAVQSLPDDPADVGLIPLPASRWWTPRAPGGES